MSPSPDPLREGADNFLGERGGVASWSGGAEVSVQQEREREREKLHHNNYAYKTLFNFLPDPKELAVGEGEMVVNGLLSANKQHLITDTHTHSPATQLCHLLCFSC